MSVTITVATTGPIASKADNPWLPTQPDEIADQVLEAFVAGASGLRRVGPRTISSPGALLNQLRRISSTGIAYEYEESAPGVACVASAVYVGAGPPVAAVSASGWIGKVNIRRVGPAVHTTALSIARALGSEPT
jgi:DNA-binding IclR family transcriptional regulator